MKTYTLLGARGFYTSTEPGKFGGHRKAKIYGKLDCPSALRAIAKGSYVQHRVFFATEKDAIACGYRPCAVCMRAEYDRWQRKLNRSDETQSRVHFTQKR
jgi:methylphosphotriester-DNA--protein-cysteine methyltransferase